MPVHLVRGMPRKPRPLAPGTLYHVTAKGNGGTLLFTDDADRGSFLALLARTIAARGWRVLAWCLMDNHVHLVVETPDPDLSAGMQWVCGQYAQRRHRRRGTYGHVFNDRFHTTVVDDDVYLLTLVRYVVANPVRAKLCPTARHWRWSSHAALAGGYEDGITSTARVDDLFGAWAGRGRERYLRWVEQDTEDLPEPLGPMSWAPPTIEELIAEHGFAAGARQALADGHSLRAIARAANISPATVTARLRTGTVPVQ